MYTVDVAIVGCYGDGKFIETTFVVPSLQPQASLLEYSVEYDTSLEVYVVERAPESPSTTEVQTSTEKQTAVDDWFDAEYIDFEEDDEDWENHDDESGISLGGFRAENFPVMSRKGGDVKNQRSLESPVPARSLDSFNSENLDSNKKPTTTKLAELLKPESFDWADEVDREEELSPPQPAEQPIQGQENQSLKYESFNWADEFDEETSPAPAQNQETGMLKYESFDWADEDEDEEVKPSGTMEQPAGDQGPGLLEHESFDWSDESDAEELVFDAGASVNQAVVYSQPRGAYSPFIVNTPPSRPSPPIPWESCEQQEIAPFSLDTEGQDGIEDGMVVYDEDSQAIAELAMQASALYEYNVRRGDWECGSQGRQTADYPYIHHFNWLGYGILEPSETPAEVSLAVILSGTKMWLCGNPTSRVAVTLNQAFQYVDPVLYEGDMEALSVKGSELQRAVTGATSKFYTSCGTWSNDSYGGDEERPILDPMDVDFYEGQACAFINGWLYQESAPTRDAELYKFQNYVGRSAWEFAERRRQPYRTSHLRSSLTADGGGESSSQCARVLRVVRGSMQYWAHEEGQEASEALPEPEAVEVEDVDGPEEGAPSEPEHGPSNDESDQSQSRRLSSETPSESTEATSTNSSDNESSSPPAPLLASHETVIHTIRRRLSFGDLRSAAVLEARQTFTQIEEARMSSPSLVLPPLGIPRKRPHSPEKLEAALPVIEPSSNNVPKARYVRLQAKSALVQATLTVEQAVPELSMPDPKTRPSGRKGIWKRAWNRLTNGMKSKFSKQKGTDLPPPPPLSPSTDAVQFLQLYARIDR